MTQTQYWSAVEWLTEVRLLVPCADGLELAPSVRGLSPQDLDEQLLGRAIEALGPTWLEDADILVRDVNELPEDAIALSDLLGVPNAAALRIVRQIHGKIDLQLRAQVGAAGERHLVDLLEQMWPNSTQHVALQHDGLGYDIAFSPPGARWHLEVKTTTRRGRLVIHLSRQEHDVGSTDPAWRLVVVGLGRDGTLAAVATARNDGLWARAPGDRSGGARWLGARYDLSADDLYAGLPFLSAVRLKGPAQRDGEASQLFSGVCVEHPPFGWMPESAVAADARKETACRSRL